MILIVLTLALVGFIAYVKYAPGGPALLHAVRAFLYSICPPIAPQPPRFA